MSDESNRSVLVQPVRKTASDAARIKLKVNGKPQTVEVSPDTPLLWVLRETLGLTGTKFGCGMALCGACTVHLNGEAVRSCVTPISCAPGKKSPLLKGSRTKSGSASRRGGLLKTCRSVVTASPARSCRPPCCFARIQSRPMKTSTTL